MIQKADDLGVAEERLARDAPPVEARPPELRPLDYRCVHSQLRRPDGGHIPPDTAPDYHYVIFCQSLTPVDTVRHVASYSTPSAYTQKDTSASRTENSRSLPCLIPSPLKERARACPILNTGVKVKDRHKTQTNNPRLSREGGSLLHSRRTDELPDHPPEPSTQYPSSPRFDKQERMYHTMHKQLVDKYLADRTTLR